MVGAGGDSSPLYIMLYCTSNRYSNSLSWVSDVVLQLNQWHHHAHYIAFAHQAIVQWYCIRTGSILGAQGPTSSLHPQFAPSLSCRCNSARSSFLFLLVASFISYKHDMMADIMFYHYYIVTWIWAILTCGIVPQIMCRGLGAMFCK